MPAPDSLLAPPTGAFAEPWQATVLAMADAMIREGHFGATEWAAALGTALRATEKAGEPDNETTYYKAALIALERLSEASGITSHDRAVRKSDWEDAYRRTPHGQPVSL